MTQRATSVCDTFQLTSLTNTRLQNSVLSKDFLIFGSNSPPLAKSWLRANTLAPAFDPPLYGIFVPQKVPLFENF